VIAVDTSVVVAAFATWHQGHQVAISVLARKPRIPAHALIESFSVLTRLPVPHRGPADLVCQFLAEQFAAAPLVLPGASFHGLLAKTIESNLIGGAIFDALIGETAKHAGATLLTRDKRAVQTYDRIGASFELVT
jgi:predicted nucleic acid-binding protein